MALLLLFILSVWATIDTGSCDATMYIEGCPTNEISFKRVTYASDERRDISVFLHGESSETLFLHALVVFADESTVFHNTLLFNPLRSTTFAPLLRSSNFQFNNEVILQTRGRRLLMQYNVATDTNYTRYFAGTSQTYDAALLLDSRASMWHEYNTIITEPGQLILRYESTMSAETLASSSVEDYQGHYTLQCNLSLSTKRCHVVMGDGLWINDYHYPGYTLVIDRARATSLLPYELYLRWKYHDERALRFREGFLLNEQFVYEIQPEESIREIVIGVDILHHFQKTLYHLPTGVFLLYYTHLYSGNAHYVLGKLFITFFINTLLILLFRWYVSDNFDVFVRLSANSGEKRARFDFDYTQVQAEMKAIILALVLWILTLIFTEPLTSAHFSYTHMAFQRRKLWLYFSSFYNIGLLLYVLMRTTTVTKRGVSQFYYWLRFKTVARRSDSDYAYVKHRVEDIYAVIPTTVMLVRNQAFHSLVVIDLLFILNYLSEEKIIYTGHYLVFSLGLVYYFIRHLVVSLLYLWDQRRFRYNRARRIEWTLFLAYTVVNTIISLVFIGLSVPIVFIRFFHEINSTYSHQLIILFAFLFILLVATAGLLSITLNLPFLKKN